MKRLPLFVLLVGLSACGPSEPEPTTEATPTPVRIVQAEAESVQDNVLTSGTLASEAEVVLAFDRGGYVDAVVVSEGERVRAGQVLARLNTTEVEAQHRAALIQADVAAKALARMERLYADSVVAEAQLDQARDAHERARSGLEIAEYARSRAVLTAPAAGRILTRHVDVSQYAGPGMAAFRFAADRDEWVVRTALSDVDVARIAVGAPARVVIPALGRTEIEGRVTEVSDGADVRAGTFGVEITLASAHPRLRSGMIGTVSIEASDAEALLSLPTSAVVDADGRLGSVFVLRDGRARETTVEIVSIGAATIAVRGEGIAGLDVITVGATYLSDGDPVSVFTSF